MTGYPRRPLAVFVCCLFAGLPAGAVAAEPSPAAADDTGVLPLRSERQFNIRTRKQPSPAGDGAAAAPAAAAVSVIADRIEGRVDEGTVAEGKVELRKAGTLVQADRAIYRPLSDEVEADGNVRMFRAGAEVGTPHLRIRLSDQIGFADRADYHILRERKNRFYDPRKTQIKVSLGNFNSSGAPMMLNVPSSYGLPAPGDAKRTSEVNGEAERVDFEGENQMRLTSATFSTCKPGRTEWYLKADEIHLDYDENEGMARHASIRFKDVPIFYLPAASFPLNGQRRSGFLAPMLSATTKTGLDLTVPYYWSIAPNYDLTLMPRQMTKRGTQLGVEARYLDYNYQGLWRAEYLPSDEVDKRERYAYRIQHQHDLGQGLSGLINWNAVSDDTYWQDLSSHLLRTSQVQLPRQLQLAYSPSPWLQGSLQVLRYQTLMLDPTIKRPYFLEPQLNIVGYRPDVFKTDLSVIGQFSRFTHDDKANFVNGDRFVLYPQVSLPIVNPAFQITPKIGLHMTKYSIDRAADSDVSRVLPIFSVDSTMTFERRDNWFGRDYIQTLEPRLYYVNIPYRDQSRIPVFDSSLNDFNFAQIFSENRYSGYDRINDVNHLTAGVVTRLIDGTSGVERFKAMIGQRYYFRQSRVVLNDAAGNPIETAPPKGSSNLVAAVNGLIAAKTYMDLAWEYNFRDNASERLAAGVRYQPELGKVLSASYRYTRDPVTGASTVDQFDIAGQWPLTARWSAVGRYNWSIRDERLLEAIAGIEYNAGCWAMRFVAQRLTAITGVPNNSFFLQLELNDFGSIGSNPLTLLRRSVPGYGKINELPDAGSPLSTQ